MVSYFKFQDFARVSPSPSDDLGGIGFGISYFIPFDKKKFNNYKSLLMYSANIYGITGKRIGYLSFSYGKNERPIHYFNSWDKPEISMNIVKFYHIGIDFIHRLRTGRVWPVIGYGISINVITEDHEYYGYSSKGGVSGDLIIGCIVKMSIINFQLLIKFVTPSVYYGKYEIIPFGGYKTEMGIYNNAGFIFNFGINLRI